MTEEQSNETPAEDDTPAENEPGEDDQTQSEASEPVDGGNDTPPAVDERCGAQTTVGGTLYQCALQEEHEGEHSFTQLETGDDDTRDEPAITDTDAAQAKALQRRAQAYSKSIAELLGDDLSGWIPCPVCTPYFPGLHPPFAAFGGAPAEVVAACRVIAGLPALDNMAQDAYSARCSTCNGVGKTLTGSTVQGHESIQCRDCGGKGWRPVGPERQSEHQAAPAPMVEGEIPAEGEGQPDVDPWGRPKGDPDYGRLPGYSG